MVTLFNTMHDVVVVKVMNDVEGQCVIVLKVIHSWKSLRC